MSTFPAVLASPAMDAECHAAPVSVYWKRRPFRHTMPPGLQAWLTDTGSLTRRIQTRCTDFRVQVVRQVFARPFLDECSLINMPADRWAWVREVLLYAEGTPVVFAHSVLPPPDLASAWCLARAIGSRPLGAALFADPLIRREPLQVARLRSGHPLLARAIAEGGNGVSSAWARRSRFIRHGRPLLVSEVFLPGIARLAAR